MWLLYALCAAMLWGLNYSLSERIFQLQLSPQSLLALQMCVGGAVFLIFSASSSIKKDMTLVLHNGGLLLLVVVELAAAIIANYLISLAIQSKDATIAGLVEHSYPIFTVFFTWILFKQNHLSPSIAIGGSLVIIGVVVMAYY